MYTMLYSVFVHKVLQTETYKKWFKKLRDERAKFAIGQRIGRMADGNFGDSKTVGGDKSTQDEDIKTAKKMAKEI